MESPVRQLEDAVNTLADADLDTAGDDELDTELVALVRLRHRLDAQIARRARIWDRRGVWRNDGSRAPWARLSRTTSMAGGSAKAILRRGAALPRMPLTAEAFTAGDLGPDVVDVLAAARNDRNELFARDEALLVTHCAELTFTQAVKMIQYWCQRADAELDRDGAPPPKPSTLRLRTGFDGTVDGDFSLDPTDGATVAEALRRIERDLYRRDRQTGTVRTRTERMAAALVEMAIRVNSAPAGGRRPEPLLCILAGEATVEHLCELATGVVITPDQIVPHLTDTHVQTFIFDGADRVVATSPQRTFRGLLRRAIQVRDRHCQHPSGCDEPITHCDVDHRIAIHEGGATSEANGGLQCEPHNRKSDLHHRQPADAIQAARERRRLEHLARQRLRTRTATAQRPPPR
jgi:hypothetical protein